MDEVSNAPSRVHPTIYIVKLNQRDSALWEACIPRQRAQWVKLWRERAKLVGKKTIEVHGKYGQLGTFDVEPGVE